MINQKEKLESTCTHQFVRTLPHPGNPSAPRRTKRCSTDGRSLSCVLVYKCKSGVHVQVYKCTSVQVVCKCAYKRSTSVQESCPLVKLNSMRCRILPRLLWNNLRILCFQEAPPPNKSDRYARMAPLKIANLQKPSSLVRSTARNDGFTGQAQHESCRSTKLLDIWYFPKITIPPEALESWNGRGDPAHGGQAHEDRKHSLRAAGRRSEGSTCSTSRRA